MYNFKRKNKKIELVFLVIISLYYRDSNVLSNFEFFIFSLLSLSNNDQKAQNLYYPAYIFYRYMELKLIFINQAYKYYD